MKKKENVKKYTDTMKLYHTTEVGEKSKFDRKCAIILEELVNAYSMHEKEIIFDKVTEYYKIKSDYDLFKTNISIMKRLLRESIFPSLIKEEDRYNKKSHISECNDILGDLRAQTDVIYKS